MDEASNEPLIDIHVDDQTTSLLKETTKWTRFISIAGIVGVALLLLVILLAGSIIANLWSRLIPAVEGFGNILVVICILIAAVLGLMVTLLYRFSTFTKRALDLQDQQLFNRGLSSLKIYFVINGLIAILTLLASITNLFKI
ncbi:MAG TPA: hypothetical protein VKR32_08185 [Puia sp.]|nr:hypothetical protein [Puia sp.]